MPPRRYRLLLIRFAELLLRGQEQLLAALGRPTATRGPSFLADTLAGRFSILLLPVFFVVACFFFFFLFFFAP